MMILNGAFISLYHSTDTTGCGLLVGVDEDTVCGVKKKNLYSAEDYGIKMLLVGGKYVRG